MSSLPYARGFRDLVVYQKSRRLAQEVFRLTRTFPKEEMYSLTDQLRRSARLVGAQIAEAWAKRRYEKHFTSKLTDADAEQQETQHWVDVALDCGYWTEETARTLREMCQEIGRLLGGMIAKAEWFCGSTPLAIREAPALYSVAGPTPDGDDNSALPDY